MTCELGTIVDLDFDALVNRSDDIKSILYQHQIVIVNDINLTPQQFTDIASAYGTVIRLPNARTKQGVDGFEDIVKIVSDSQLGYVPTPNFWHADQSWCRTNPNLTFFYSRIVPDYGGATKFADTRRAYTDLPRDMKLFLQDKIAYYRHNKTNIKAENYPTDIDLTVVDLPIDAYHELTPMHPVTRQRSVYDPMGHCSHIVGIPAKQSHDILEYLRRHLIQEHFVYAHYYKPNQLVFWDNTSLIHSAPVPNLESPRELWQLRVRDQKFFEEPTAMLDHKI
jgi:taurine dioxygenase